MTLELDRSFKEEAELVDPVLDMLKKVGAVYTNDHFVYTSGKHGAVYVNKDAMYLHPIETTLISRLFAERYQRDEVDVVVGPAVGAIVLSQWTAYHLTQLKSKEVLGVYTEKDKEDNQILRRGYAEIVKGRNCLIVEDVTTTGGSIVKVINTVIHSGGNVIAASSMVNRNPDEVNSTFLGVPFSSLCTLKADAYEENECLLCQDNIPINTKVGHGKDYLAKHSIA